MVQWLKQLWNDDKGATAVEYGLIIALIAGAIIAGVTAVGANTQTTFDTVSKKLTVAP